MDVVATNCREGCQDIYVILYYIPVFLVSYILQIGMLEVQKPIKRSNM